MGSVPPPPTRWKKTERGWEIDLERSRRELREWAEGRSRFYLVAGLLMFLASAMFMAAFLVGIAARMAGGDR
jgi:hypothetical protein